MNDMIKIGGITYDNLNEQNFVYLINKGDLKKVGDGYFWTEKHFRRLIKSSRKFVRKINSPFWRLYYKIFD